MNQNKGFSLVELMMVTTVVAVVLVAASSYFSGRVALRRSVDNVTANIATTLQLVKLKAARDGVEYRAVFASCESYDDDDPDCVFCEPDNYDDYAEGDQQINIIVERGDSNSGSSNWCIQEEQTKKFQSDLDFVTSANFSDDPEAIAFLPSGLRSDFRDDTPGDNVISIEPLSGAPIDKCGLVQVTPFGAVRVVHGRWDGTVCNPILDDAPPTPEPS